MTKESQPFRPEERTDSRYWKWGAFYANPADPELFVPRRLGSGITLNFAHRNVKLFFMALLIPPVAVLLILLGLWLVDKG